MGAAVVMEEAAVVASVIFMPTCMVSVSSMGVAAAEGSGATPGAGGTAARGATTDAPPIAERAWGISASMGAGATGPFVGSAGARVVRTVLAAVWPS